MVVVVVIAGTVSTDGAVAAAAAAAGEEVKMVRGDMEDPEEDMIGRGLPLNNLDGSSWTLRRSCSPFPGYAI